MNSGTDPSDGQWQLQGLLTHAKERAPGRIDHEFYAALLAERWTEFLDSPEAKVESNVQSFLERHPSLLPGAFTVDGDSGHEPYPGAVITQPKLPSLSSKQPDFMWIATDSEAVYPVLIELETPYKKWFYGKRDLTHAQGQLAEWRAWFRRGSNLSNFVDLYELPDLLRRRTLKPRYVLVHGRRSDYASDAVRQQKRAELRREDERIMSFDRLFPHPKALRLSCVKKDERGYRAVKVSPAFVVIWGNRSFEAVDGWESVLRNCSDLPSRRAQYLTRKLAELKVWNSQPNRVGLRAYRPEWL